MTELKPLREFLNIELWQYEDEEIGWKMTSNCNTAEEQDRGLISRLLFEMAETFVGDVKFSMYVREKSIVTRYPKGVDYSQLEDYLWMRTQLYQTQWFVLGRDLEPKWRIHWWKLCWFVHKLSGRFKASESKAKAAATPLPATAQEGSLNLFTALGTPSQVTSATVLPFRHKDK